MNPIFDIGTVIIPFLNTVSPYLDSVMKFITFLGTIEFYLLLIPFIYWIVDPGLGFRLLLVLISTDFFAMGFKQILRQPRPYWISDVKALATETSYGIPSSHASDSLAVWGYLAYRLKKSWLWAFGAILVALVSLSRIYLGVHFLMDVLGGWLLGLVIIIIFGLVEHKVVSRLERIPITGQIGTGFAISLLMIFTGWLIHLAISPIADPPEWAEFAAQARSISHYFTLAGSLFGSVAGYALARSRLRFHARGSVWQYFARYLLGIMGVLVIYQGLDVLFGLAAPDDTIIGLVLRYLRYGAVTFWAIFAAPWLFLKLKLAHSDTGDPAGEMAA